MNNRDIIINGLTPRQKKMLTVMWNLDSPEEYFEWYENLSEPMQRQADILQRMLLLAMVDNQMLEEHEVTGEAAQYPDARKVLGKFTLKGHL